MTLEPILAYFGAVLPLLGSRGSTREVQERLIGIQKCPRKAKERPKRAPESPKGAPREPPSGPKRD